MLLLTSTPFDKGIAIICESINNSEIMNALQLWVSLTRDTLREDKLGQAGQSRLTRLTPLMQHSLSPHTHVCVIWVWGDNTEDATFKRRTTEIEKSDIFIKHDIIESTAEAERPVAVLAL